MDKKESSHVIKKVHDVVSKMKGPYNYQDTAKNLDKISAETHTNLSTNKKPNNNTDSKNN